MTLADEICGQREKEGLLQLQPFIIFMKFQCIMNEFKEISPYKRTKYKICPPICFIPQMLKMRAIIK